MRKLALTLVVSLAVLGCKKKADPPPPAPAPARAAAPAPAPAAAPAAETKASVPDGMKLFVDTKNGFQVNVPTDWSSDDTDSNFAIQFKAKDEGSVWGITVSDYPEAINAKELADEIEKSLGKANQFDAEQSTMSKKLLDRAHADDGRLALYEVGEGTDEVTQRLWVFTKGKKSFVITETGLGDENYPDRVEMFDKMVESFVIQ